MGRIGNGKLEQKACPNRYAKALRARPQN